jgi:hypothetical protein
LLSCRGLFAVYFCIKSMVVNDSSLVIAVLAVFALLALLAVLAVLAMVPVLKVLA